jgi:hypothetical protein
MNIPARYANGFLGDIGVPPDPAPMDYNAWFEVFLDGRWFTFDARHNTPRIGRITVARGRDAADISDVLWATRLEDLQGLDGRSCARCLEGPHAPHRINRLKISREMALVVLL